MYDNQGNMLRVFASTVQRAGGVFDDVTDAVESRVDVASARRRLPPSRR